MRACRTCLTKKDLNPLFGDLSAVRFTSKQLYLATGVSIQPNDNLPQVACNSCIKQIKKSLDFRYISSKTNVYLRQILKNVEMKSGLINKSNSTNHESPDRYFETSDNNKMFAEVKIEEDFLQDSDIDNNEIDNSQFFISHNNFDDKQDNNSHFDYQTNYDRNDKSQPDNKKNCLDNEESDNYTFEIYQNCKSQSDNHNSQLDKHHNIDNKKLSNNKEHITSAKRQKTKQITIKINKNMTKKKLPNRKLKIQNNKSISDVDLSKRINIKIEGFETDSKNSDFYTYQEREDKKSILGSKLNKNESRVVRISNTSSNDHEMASKDDKNIDDEIQYQMLDKSKTKQVTIGRQKCEQKRNNLMSLAVTPYPSEGPIQCRICKEHLKVTSFVMHAKRHFAPEFTCEECGKMFRSHAHMVYHQQRMHGREKRLACNLCDFRTVDRLKLKNHERGHSGERPYQCDECGSSFRMRTNIVQHMRTHFGVRNIQCELCANLFRSKSELSNHKNKVHNKMTYLCYLCPQTYKGKRAVRRHLMNLHGVIEDQILKIKCIKTKKFEEIPTS